MKDFRGKKLLIIGGAFQHCKIVEAAHKLGVITYVIDYLPLEKAPAKKISNYHYEINITDYDDIVDLCIKEGIEGAIATSLDACQKPYQEICSRMKFPCFGTKDQYSILTDKKAFKEFGRNNGLDIIPSYTEEDVLSGDFVEFPVLVKPALSRGSRGQTICSSPDEVMPALEFAKSESFNKEALIEKYMIGHDEFTMTYIVVNGEPIIIRTGDRFLGSKEDGLDKLCIAGISPSRYNDFYLDKVNNNVCTFIKNLGITNGPVFMQGFIDGDTVRFFDPGLRFPGIEYERMFNAIYNVNLEAALIEFALTGHSPEDCLSHNHNSTLNGKYALDILIALKPGMIAEISGIDEIKKKEQVISVFQRCKEGEEIKETHNVNQRLCEIDFVCNSIEEAKEITRWIYSTLSVKDVEGKEMISSKLDVNLLG